jgi:hypothetical protein
MTINHDILSKEQLEKIEKYFQYQKESLGIFGETEEFEMIFALIASNKALKESVQDVTAKNRHYLFKFYDGDINEFMKNFKYLT